MNWKIIFERGMFWIIFIPFIVVITGLVEVGTYGINKTVGWAYDIPDLQVIIVGFLTFSCLLFLVGYGILFFSGIKTNLNLSIIHFIVFYTTYIPIIFLNKNKVFGFILALLSFIIFIVNIIWAFKNRKRLNKSTIARLNNPK